MKAAVDGELRDGEGSLIRWMPWGCRQDCKVWFYCLHIICMTCTSATTILWMSVCYLWIMRPMYFHIIAKRCDYPSSVQKPTHGSRGQWSLHHQMLSTAAKSHPAQQLQKAEVNPSADPHVPHLNARVAQLIQPMSSTPCALDYLPLENIAIVHHVNPPNPHHKLQVPLQ